MAQVQDIHHQNIDPILKSEDNQAMKQNKGLPASLIRNLALILIVVLLVGWLGWFIGKNKINSFNDIYSLVKNGTPAGNPEIEQTIDRNQPTNANVDMRLFWAVWDKLEADYLFKEKIDYQKMVYGAIEGMTAALGDPYTTFLPPAENKTTKENLNGAFFGVGIQLGYKKDNIVVIAPITGMPAEKAGVLAGDYILKIVDKTKGVEQETYNIGINEAVEIIRGLEGTEVTLTLLHQGESEPYDVTIKREEIVVPSVEVAFGKVNKSQFYPEATATVSGELVAHLRLTRFGELTDDQWDKAIVKIVDRRDEISGVVLDLRNNPGGYMQESVNLASEFLPTGKVVVKQEHSQMPDKSFATKRYGRLLSMPLIILVNGGSASASEILAGALRDHERAQIVGTQSFGKGTIQSTEDFEGGAGLHITIARWLTPNDTWVHDKGLTPDVEIKLDKDQPDVDVQLGKAAVEVVK